MEKAGGDGGDFIDGGQKCVLIGLRRFVKTGDFSYELERSGSNLVFSDGRIEVEKGFDVAAHAVALRLGS
jgi:hypothetical protein